MRFLFWFSFLLGASIAALAVPASADDDTIVVTLQGLPPASTSPPRLPITGYPNYHQPPVRSDRPMASQSPPVLPPASRREVVARLGICELHGTTIYRGRNGEGQPLTRVAQGAPLAIKSEYGGWYAVMMIDGSLGWITKSAVRLLDYNVVRPAPAAPSGPVPAAPGFGNAVLQEAFRYIGVPYVWGGNTQSGLDCSGLVKNCFARCGVSLPRRASEQARFGQPVPPDLQALQPGDRLYFAVGRPSIDHTGIYLGNGWFIHASMSRGKVAVDRLNKPLYGRHLVAARRT